MDYLPKAFATTCDFPNLQQQLDDQLHAMLILIDG